MADYVLEGPKWQAGQAVTYSFATTKGSAFDDLVTGAYQNVFRDALAAWAKVAALTFVEIADGVSSDIRFGWAKFTAASGVIGETDVRSAPGRPSQMATGITVALDDPAVNPVAPTDTATYGDGHQITLMQVAIHEIGHALGLDHSSQPTSVMYAVSTTSNRQVSAYDVAGIQALYGRNPTYQPPAQPQPQPAAGPTTPPTAATPATPTAVPATPIVIPITPNTVYRFFDTRTGTQFLSDDGGEVNGVANTRPDLRFEGAAMRDVTPDATDPNVAPVSRFFSKVDGTHFFTIDANETRQIQATRPDMVLEASTFSEHLAAVDGDTPVYRFFDSRHGTHFFTPNESERASIVQTRPDLVAEGVAFYAPKIA